MSGSHPNRGGCLRSTMNAQAASRVLVSETAGEAVRSDSAPAAEWRGCATSDWRTPVDRSVNLTREMVEGFRTSRIRRYFDPGVHRTAKKIEPLRFPSRSWGALGARLFASACTNTLVRVGVPRVFHSSDGNPVWTPALAGPNGRRSEAAGLLG